MKTYTLSEIKTIVSRLARQYGAERIYLFGSFCSTWRTLLACR